jgi:uncharacterized protein YndB with AHSA1/START domain
MTPLTLKTDGETEIVITRNFAARPELVWRAHTEPALLQRWCLGPDGWTMPVCICEARPGGRLHYEWAKDGRGFSLSGEFIALTPYARIEHVERMHLPEATPDNHVVTEFSSHKGGTRMVMTMTLPDAATRQMMLASGMDKGMEISYQRLEATLEGVA